MFNGKRQNGRVWEENAGMGLRNNEAIKEYKTNYVRYFNIKLKKTDILKSYFKEAKSLIGLELGQTLDIWLLESFFVVTTNEQFLCDSIFFLTWIEGSQQ